MTGKSRSATQKGAKEYTHWHKPRRMRGKADRLEGRAPWQAYAMQMQVFDGIEGRLMEPEDPSMAR